MTTNTSVEPSLRLTPVRARSAGFFADLMSVAGRAVRAIPREPEAIIPALVIPIFFYVVNLGALSDVTESIPGFNFKAFYLPVGLVFAVTGISRASALVTDIQSGYFDRLLLTPIRRLALLMGLMVADVLLMMSLTIPVLILGFIVGVRFETGPLGVVALIVMTGAWGLAFTGFPYAIALKTGNPAAVNTSFLLFFPFAFLTTAFTPRDLLSGWLDAIAGVNPVTYLLDGMRSLILDGWVARDIGIGVLAIIGVGVFSQALAFAALRGRISRA
jgi:ABC-2 type transport system permease protein